MRYCLPVSTTAKTLAKMRNNPRDWRIEDLEAVAKAVGLGVRKAAGSHVTFSADGVRAAVTVPAHKPNKPAYIRLFLDLVEKTKGETP